MPALGCTEPIAVSYRPASPGGIRRHNPESCLPRECKHHQERGFCHNSGTHGRNGMKLACALGLVKPDIDRKLEILDGLTEEQLNEALQLVGEDRISVELANVKCALYAEVEIETISTTRADDHAVFPC